MTRASARLSNPSPVKSKFRYENMMSPNTKCGSSKCFASSEVIARVCSAFIPRFPSSSRSLACFWK
eukprot:CAMPEP_0197702276 /NCGR_PEP_ID=MMETSP1338-20131121/124295_1 /TAXON_ID=43686 ORGANISM="Pelagodinium beii, Strain RCC1491" /NCGR_SAMPLE_ID=MMETSP1338 /ASSEMBLY_ACC=CAM_ASM_000754 /LENGTH=65 /DNA_ID=CAMNT_0043286087 /DNA_START=118 /DNA_END=315 /DNA_ORIENTATION=-